ncbi:MAG: glycosyltransferase, partial [Methanobacterium sp.]
MNKSIISILQINTTATRGGAARIACDLFRFYQSQGCFSWMIVGKKKTNDPKIFTLPERTVLGSRFLYNLIRKIERLTSFLQISDYQKGLEDFDFIESKNILNILPEKPDILHCHNLHGGFFDLRALPILSSSVPTVLTLHDAWLMSGHCAHSFDCDLWKSGCGNCPDLSIYPAIPNDATAINWKRKSDIFSKSQYYVVTPCRWLMDRVDQSILRNGMLGGTVIHNGVNSSIFFPASKKNARFELNLPADKMIILFTANDIRNNIWRDYSTLKNALSVISKSEKNILCIALGEKSQSEFIGEIEIRFIPYIYNQKIVAEYYRACDVYVHPSRMDTFPTTILEALSCGVPVIASNVGGIPEQIIDGKTGFLVPVGNADNMAEKLLVLLQNEEIRQDMGRFAANDALERFSLNKMITEYLTLYQAILNGKICNCNPMNTIMILNRKNS